MQNMDDIISLLTNEPSLINDLSNNEVDFLIEYLKDEIQKKEKVLKEIEAD